MGKLKSTYLDHLQKERSERLKESDALWQFRDKSILTLAGGGFLLSATFIRNIIGNDEAVLISLLYIAWACLAGAIVSMLIAYHAATESKYHLLDRLNGAIHKCFHRLDSEEQIQEDLIKARIQNGLSI